MAMSPEQIISLVGLVIGAAQKALELGRDAAPFIKVLKDDIFGGKEPTEEDRAVIEAKVADLTAKILAPLPPAEPDET